MSRLKIYSGNQLETLARMLAEVLKTPLSSPLAEEIVVVQSRGMERWVRMELARQHGICANVAFPFPNTFIHKIFEATFHDLPLEGPFDTDVMTWRIMKLLPTCAKQTGFETIRSYLGQGFRPLKWYQLSEKIADIFDQYLLYRPDMILQWQEGKAHHWQAQLWRKLVQGRGKSHRAALRRKFLQRAQRKEIVADELPERISVFGLATLPPYHIEIIEAISTFVDVNLFLMNPCKEYWADIFSDREIIRVSERTEGRADTPDELHFETGNSLLASMGTIGRDFFAMIAAVEFEGYDYFLPVEESDGLSCIQSDILNLRDPGSGEKRTIQKEDASIQIHSCHSPLREMEVLKDNLLDIFEKHPDLRPADILVMAPDIETYAPFIQSVFGGSDESQKRTPFSIADRSLNHASQLVEVFFTILDLPKSRFSAPEVLALLECEALREEFHLSKTDMSLVSRWVRETKIRWARDGEDRKALGLPPFKENTWLAGLDRLLLGYALPGRNERLFRGVLPYDHVEGSEAFVLGNFAEFLTRLSDCVTDLTGARSLNEWSGVLSGLLDGFFAPNRETQGEIQRIRFALHDLRNKQEASGFHEEVGIDVPKAYLARLLAKEGFGGGFITGAVTFCAMLPMRSIPFKVICLVGMNHDAYPRQGRKLGFDLIAAHPRPGDRSRRNDDRYLFLEAIVSARQTLYISYVGQSIRDNSEIPPSVLVSELLDYLELGFEIPGKTVTGHLTTKHRLQAFSPPYFTGNDRLFSYSEENAEAAARASQMRKTAKPFFTTRLAAPSHEWRTIELAQLQRFFTNPAKFICRERLGIALEADEGRMEEVEDFTLEKLEKYKLEQLLVERGLAGWDFEKALPVIKASGRLPHGAVGTCVYDELHWQAAAFLSTLEPRLAGRPLEPLEFTLHLAGCRLHGRIKAIFTAGLIQYRYANLKAKDHLRLWLQHLAFNASIPGHGPCRSILLGKEEVWSYEAVEESRELLTRLVEAYLDGLTKPLHFFPESSLCFAQAILEKGKAEALALSQAGRTWTGGEFNRGEGADLYYQLCFGQTDPLDHAFRDLAFEVYAPLLQARTKDRK